MSRKRYAFEFKPRVALDAPTGEPTRSESVSKYVAHVNQIFQ